MPPSAPPPERLARLLTGNDYFRRSPSRMGGRGAHKEWQHFLVHTEAAHLLINFSLIDDVRATQGRQPEVARLIVLARGEGWEGDVEHFEEAEVEVTAGRIDARFGHNTLRFIDGTYRLSIALRDQPLAAELELVPVTLPALSVNQPLTLDRRLSWLFVPRLLARGTLRLAGRTVQVNDAPAYHDHNWGHFLWGNDFSWEWGSVLPWDMTNPWSLVHVRMADRGRSVARYQGLFLWHGGEPLRVFRDEELRVLTRGSFRKARPFSVPRVMALLAPGTAADLPETLEIAAHGGADTLELSFHPQDSARIVTPSEEHPEQVTIIHEVLGRVTAQGRVRGHSVAMEGTGVFEFIRD
ncbi:hypothetical protein D7V80_27380 [Corallococcus sp. CA054B]|uniref:hypothetical protein n=1 Tax=Corallococcus sp. CA054B TaxID=2316734 RepID=UPI000EA1B71B|nr:hypothetical protein [Corallococcus sp. CA054B]RKG64315.1 hypothetical protein D7V80_27380 [Corallococcus sp. CA054B]